MSMPAEHQSSSQVSTTARRMASIAEQLNLLAFNERIDSTRASVGGRQFAVVANQVRELALSPLAHPAAS